jgi:ornithine cyclodeaminase/alanine dehydrogenase-like protein (mu-crystallin family)
MNVVAGMFMTILSVVCCNQNGVIHVEDVQELVKNSDIIITATTSLTPVLPEIPSLYKGKVVIGGGSFDRNMREFPKVLFEGIDYYFVDSEQGKVECGDIIDPLKKLG